MPNSKAVRRLFHGKTRNVLGNIYTRITSSLINKAHWLDFILNKGRRVPFDEQGRNSPLMKNQITCLSQNINGSKKLNRIGNLYRTLGCDVLLFQ